MLLLRQRLRGRSAGTGRVDAAVRQAAWLFTAAGTLGLITDFIPGQAGYGKPVSIGLDAMNFCIGWGLWTPLAGRITRRWSLVFALIALATVATSDASGAIPPPTLGVWFILIFIWVGSWFPRGTPLLLGPVAAVAYVMPLWYGAPRPTDAFGSVILVVPVAVLAGEVIARNVAEANRSASEQQAAVEALARANMTDDLTGLGNRRCGNQLLESLGAGDAIAILDLDHFKQVNDMYGHARGDVLLQDLGGFLTASLRANDAAARMGGEEFLVVLRQVSLAEATAILQRLIDSWREHQPLSTLSVGIAGHDASCSALDSYRAADNALYRAKQEGRDQIAVAGPDQLPGQRPASAHDDANDTAADVA